jgi:hypothetical protein
MVKVFKRDFHFGGFKEGFDIFKFYYDFIKEINAVNKVIEMKMHFKLIGKNSVG